MAVRKFVLPRPKFNFKCFD